MSILKNNKELLYQIVIIIIIITNFYVNFKKDETLKLMYLKGCRDTLIKENKKLDSLIFETNKLKKWEHH